MFDIGWSELLVIAVIAIIVIGPKDLPFVLRAIGRFAARTRALAREFQSSLEDVMRESEMAELRRQIEDADRTTRMSAPGRPAPSAAIPPAAPAEARSDAGAGEPSRDVSPEP